MKNTCEMEMLKKSMTKKQLRKHFSNGRSKVGASMNLGTRDMSSPKAYSRKKEKAKLRTMLKTA